GPQGAVGQVLAEPPRRSRWVGRDGDLVVRVVAPQHVGDRLERAGVADLALRLRPDRPKPVQGLAQATVGDGPVLALRPHEVVPRVGGGDEHVEPAGTRSQARAQLVLQLLGEQGLVRYYEVSAHWPHLLTVLNRGYACRQG